MWLRAACTSIQKSLGVIKQTCHEADIQQNGLASMVFGELPLSSQCEGPRPPWCAHGIGPSSRGKRSTDVKCPDEKQRIHNTNKQYVFITGSPMTGPYQGSIFGIHRSGIHISDPHQRFRIKIHQGSVSVVRITDPHHSGPYR